MQSKLHMYVEILKAKGNQLHKDLFEGKIPQLGQFPSTLWKFTAKCIQ